MTDPSFALKPLPEEPWVTVVTPSFNQGRFIEETIQSVLNQDYPRLEYIIMDGGSTDETAEVAARYRDRLTFISEPDRGQTHAINKGFRLACGEIVAYLNSDDTYLPGAVSAAVAALQRQPGAALVYGQAHHVDEAGRILEAYPTRPFSAELLQEVCFICQPAVFIRRAALSRIGFLDEGLQYCMDYDLWYRLSRYYDVVHLPHFLANSRLWADNKTLGQRRVVHWEISRMWKRHLGVVPAAWIFGLAHAIVETRLKLNRARPLQNAAFVLLLTLSSYLLFLGFNRRVRPEEARVMKEWLGWFRDGFKKQIGWTK